MPAGVQAGGRRRSADLCRRRGGTATERDLRPAARAARQPDGTGGQLSQARAASLGTTKREEGDHDGATTEPDRTRFHRGDHRGRSEEHTSELQSLMRISYAVFCLKKKKTKIRKQRIKNT